MTEDLHRTFQTRLPACPSDPLLWEYARLFSSVERSLFAAFASGKEILKIKSEFLRRFGVTARQFNSARFVLEGKIRSKQEGNRLRLAAIKRRIEQLEEKIPKIRSDLVRYQKSTLLVRLKAKHASLNSDIKAKRIRLCFGGKKLFHQQHSQNYQEWKQVWDHSRNCSFFSVGSKDETGGNQSCTLSEENGTFTLRLRLPPAVATSSKYLYVHGITFAYGHEEILEALQENRAISCRFVRDHKGWRLFVSIPVCSSKTISDERRGCIGIDINTDHIAATVIDRFGNLKKSHIVPLVLYGKNKNQAKALIGDCSAKLVDLASTHRLPLVVEELNFVTKKQSLKDKAPKEARLLSSFAYRQILQTICSRATRKGIEVRQVNPAFTSVIGPLKFAKRYGLSAHTSAALCIGRRYQRYSERLSERADIPTRQGHWTTCALPARTGQMKGLCYLKEVAKSYRAAHAGHPLVTNRQSSGSQETCVTNFQRVGGEIPPRESPLKLLE